MKKNKFFFLLIVQIFLISTVFLTINSTSLKPSIFSILIYKNSPITTNAAPKLSWENNGTAICNVISTAEEARICCAGGGNVIIAWVDNRNGNSDIYAQKIAANGATLWQVNGTPICTADQDQDELEICSDGEGGAILTWEDARDGYSDIYAQRILADETLLWDDNGSIVCNWGSDTYHWDPNICSDGNGGAFIAWEDYRDYYQGDIYAQHIFANGTISWGNGTASDKNGTIISNVGAGQTNVELCLFSNDIAFLVWRDGRDYSTNGYDIYAQLVSLNGSLAWGNGTLGDKNGSVMCNEIGNQNTPEMYCDSNGMVIMAWDDFRGDGDIYAQITDGTGYQFWGNGTVICDYVNKQQNPDIGSIGDDGVIITWEDYRFDPSGYYSDIYAQRIDSSGSTYWGNGTAGDKNGSVICDASWDQIYPQICCDGKGRGIIVWADNRTNNEDNYDVYAQRINEDGNTLWTDNGVIISNADDDQEYPVICCDSLGNAVIAWVDWRNTRDIYAQRISEVTGGGGNPIGILLLLLEEPSNLGLTIGLILLLVIGIGVVIILYMRQKQ